MAAGGKSKANDTGADCKGRKRKHYLPHNKPVKKKGYPLRPGVQGFFITCDGGRERQASREAINVIDSFYEELVHGNGAEGESAGLSTQPANKKIKFAYSESSSGEEEDKDDDDDSSSEEDGDAGDGEEEKEEASKSDACTEKDADPNSPRSETTDEHKKDEAKEQSEGAGGAEHAGEAAEPPVKKQCLEKESSKVVTVERKEPEKSVDKLIEAELEELADKNKRRFFSLDSGCNGVIFVQMRKRGGEPGPTEIVQRMMTTAASTRKHMSRFILRILPIEASCYASEEEISRAIKPLVDQYFPIETENPQKFAVLYDARANSGIDRMKIVNSVAKSIPGPHKVDLKNPDKSIVVQIVKTVCLIGVVEKYKELSKYNLRQLTSPKP